MDEDDGFQISLGDINNLKKKVVIWHEDSKKIHNQAMECYEKGQVNQSIELYKKAGKLGCNKSYFNLWQVYGKGEKIKKDIPLAIRYLKKAAGLTDRRVSILNLNLDGTGGLSEALFTLAILHGKGQYVEKNSKYAFWCYKKAADMGHEKAIHKMSRLCLEEENVQQAIPYLKKASELGYPDAQYSLGAIYLSGTNVEKNIPLGLQYLEKSATDGYIEASFLLGRTYANGYHGVQKDIHLGRKYLKMAASEGDVEACYELGLLDLNVEVLPLCLLYLEMAADKKHNQACVKLGTIYINGEGVEPNVPLGIKYLETAADNTYEDALMQLGYLYFDGEKVEKSFLKALHYFQKASVLDNGLADVRLGWIFYDPESPLRSLEKAIGYFQKAKKLGFEKEVSKILHKAQIELYNLDESYLTLDKF